MCGYSLWLGQIPLWFARQMAPFVIKFLSYGYRSLPYIDYFLMIPTPHGVFAVPEDCRRARKMIDALMQTFELRRHQEKGNGMELKFWTI